MALPNDLPFWINHERMWNAVDSTTPDIDAAQMSAFSLTDFPG